ncbi:glycosyltransferase involved in cell wall biosynthesis [Rhodococcus sp. LBL1]|nr:glycosyltransferase involved in cell wall biosynthesis [Rhodococcus sp. LBL1]MDH6684487.1 glycosyltransferase involved in cell wall biosynthesis [Rhodococcus sp. LBL2]
MSDPQADAETVTVVIPCRNESGALPAVLAALPDGYRALVVDNGSEDETAHVARECGADVVYEPRPGYGSAVHTGVVAARTSIVCVLDGDGSLDPGDLPALVSLVRGGADVAVGRRRPVSHVRWPIHARLGNALVARRLRRRYGLDVHDIGAARAARREVLLTLGITDRRSGYPLELLVRAARAGLRVAERDVAYRPRTAGVSKVSGSVVGSVHAARDFWKVLVLGRARG